MSIFINGTGNISPFGYGTTSEICRNNAAYHSGDNDRAETLRCVEPDYKEYLDPLLLRRMSRILKMGATASRISLDEAGVVNPDAVIVGTGLGCITDTEKFLTSMLENEEKMLMPASFIQSTHNSIAAQVAIMIKCNGYNSTCSQRGFSFEGALLDGMMLINEKEAENVLIGGIDEVTDTSCSIQEQLGLYAHSYAGEGSHFFMLSDSKSSSTYAQIKSIDTFLKPAETCDILSGITAFLHKNSLTINDLDYFMIGWNPEFGEDEVYAHIRENTGNHICPAGYKHLSGEYMTSASSAVSLCAGILKTQYIPDFLSPKGKGGPGEKTINNILIYNHFQNINHSLILLGHADI